MVQRRNHFLIKNIFDIGNGKYIDNKKDNKMRWGGSYMLINLCCLFGYVFMASITVAQKRVEFIVRKSDNACLCYADIVTTCDDGRENR